MSVKVLVADSVKGENVCESGTLMPLVTGRAENTTSQHELPHDFIGSKEDHQIRASMKTSLDELPMAQKLQLSAKPDKPDEPDTPAGIEDNEQERCFDDFEEIPEFIYEKLPPVLKELMDVFKPRQDKEIVLLSSLAVLSGCFPSMYGIYDGKELNLNMYFAIIGPAGCGKSVAGWARYIVADIEETYLVKGKMLFFPADTSSSALVKALKRNDESGILFAFEIDTMTQNWGKEWGNISSLLRQAFQQESYEAIRNGEIKETQEITVLKKPSLSLILTGTPNQIKKLIPNTEDGLFSRFAFYSINRIPEWRDVFNLDSGTGVKPSVNEQLVPLKKLFMKIVSAYDINLGRLRFDLTDDQKHQLNKHFDGLSETYLNRNGGDDIIAVIRRQGLMSFRIAGILTALRKYENIGETLLCSDDDFLIAMTLSNVFINSAVTLAKRLPKSLPPPISETKQRFLDKLPSIIFTKKDADKIGKKIGIKADTVEKYLHDLQPNYIRKEGHNKYQKLQK
ncbi:MAG: DUF3987 domain-containing protein [Bacteroidota bacterium]